MCAVGFNLRLTVHFPAGLHGELDSFEWLMISEWPNLKLVLICCSL
jgi:hypothetical protein